MATGWLRGVLAAAGIGLAVPALAVSALAAEPAANAPVVFGLVMPTSGWFAPIDAATIKGAKLAVDDINAAGGIMGHPIQLAEFDTKSEPPLGADGAVDVIGRGARAILVPSDFDFGAPGAFIAQQKGVLVFSGASDPKFGVQGIGNLAFSTSNAAQAQGALLAEWARNTQHWKTAYVLTDNTISYTKSLCGSFAAHWQEIAGSGALLGQDTFLNGDASIAAQRTRILNLPQQPDLIVLCSYAPGGPSAIRQLRAAGIGTAIATGESMDGDYWLGSVPDLSHFYVVNYGSVYGDDPDAAVNRFFDRYKAKWGERADVSYALRGYAAVEAYAHAATRAGSFDAQKVAAALEQFHDEPLVIGPTTYSHDLHIQVQRPMTILEAEHGTFHTVGRFSVKEAKLVAY